MIRPCHCSPKAAISASKSDHRADSAEEAGINSVSKVALWRLVAAKRFWPVTMENVFRLLPFFHSDSFLSHARMGGPSQ
jgi:hypothetical protein